MNQRELKDRTKKYALRVISLVNSLPRTVQGRVIANQLMKSGTSVAANSAQFVDLVQMRNLFRN